MTLNIHSAFNSSIVFKGIKVMAASITRHFDPRSPLIIRRMPCLKARKYSWVLNNYDEAELESLRQCLSDKSEVSYALFGYEVGEQGTPHLQGYVSFKRQKSLTAAKKVLTQRAHIEICGGGEADNIAYCKKGEQPKEEWNRLKADGPSYGRNARFEEFGVPVSQGKRNDLEGFQELVKSGVRDLKRIREDCPEIAAKYPRYVEAYIRDQFERPSVPDHVPRPWQQQVFTLLRGDICPRKIIWVYDKAGDSGKSWLCDKWEELYGNSLLINPGKHADMVYAFYSSCSEPRVIFVDITKSRTNKDSDPIIPYEFLEHCKNGRMTNTKYKSETFYFKRPHVCVMSNHMPDEERLGRNRFHYVMVPQERD